MKNQLKNLKTHLSCSLIAAAMIAPVCAQMDTTTMPASDKNGMANEKGNMKALLSNDDKQFLMKAGMGGMLEVKVSKLAQEKGTSAEVKELAEMMVKDHSKANAELMTLASSKGVTLPTDLDAKHASKYDGMTKMSGADFDKNYVKDMLADHEKTIALFEGEAKKGDDAEVKAFAAKTLPTLNAHLEHVRKLSGK